MATCSLIVGRILGIPEVIWYPTIVILLIILIYFYIRYRKQMSS